MTGFGKASGTFENKNIRVEIKSLNSKSLDLHVRMPHSYKEREIDLRKKIGAALNRGKIECNILVESEGNEKTNVLNKEVVKAYYEEIRGIETELGIESSDTLQNILKLPDVFSAPMEEMNEEEWAKIDSLVDEAHKNLKDFRGEEGRALVEEFTARINGIDKLLGDIPAYEDERIVNIKTIIEGNIQEFMSSTNVDKNRLEQELIYYIEKIDISEEKQRLAKHLSYFIETLNTPDSNGKKLGFISQEIGREINTLGSKSYHSEMQKCVVQMKDELEKIKEQVLNTL